MEERISVLEMGARNRAAYEASRSYDLNLYDDLLECTEKTAHPIDWDKVKEAFGEYKIPSCGMTDAERLGGSDDKKQSSGTIYLG